MLILYHLRTSQFHIYHMIVYIVDVYGSYKRSWFKKCSQDTQIIKLGENLVIYININGYVTRRAI